MSVYWRRNITGDDFLLDLGEIIYSQTFPFTQIFTSHNWWHTGSMHCVNLAHGMKTPLIYYQRHPEQKYVDAAKQGLKDINTFISGPHGVIIGDEALHGNNPTQGSELCTGCRDDVLSGEYVANHRRSRLCIPNRTHCIQCTSDTDLG